MEEIKYKTKKELKEAGMKIVCLLNPFIYPDTSKRVCFEMEKENGTTQNFNPTILGLIGFINGALHQLEHQEKKDFKE